MSSTADGSKSLAPVDFSEAHQKLYSAVIADILDDLGYPHQALDVGIRPVGRSLPVLGTAFTVLATDVYEVPEKPYKKELEAVDKLSEGDVLVATTNGSKSSGFWGELLSTVALGRGATGAVIDGLTRDSARIMELGFPLFARGYSPLDSKGRTDVIAYDVPIECGGIEVRPGDLVFGDHDGVVIVPHQIVRETIDKAVEKVSSEDEVRQALENGMSAVEAYDKYGVL